MQKMCVCVWAALHIHYAVSYMQTAVSILSADLEVLVVNAHILPHIHSAFFSSQQCPKKFFENPWGGNVLEICGQVQFFIHSFIPFVEKITIKMGIHKTEENCKNWRES